jgi:SAM-dependent methyltransferase
MNTVKCNLCGYDNFKVVYDIAGKDSDGQRQVYKITAPGNLQNNLRLVRCLRCGLVYANPTSSIEEIYRQYAQLEDELYIAEEKGRRIAAKAILKKIARYKGGKRLLEVGCAAGFLLDEARSLGWEVYGVDPSRWLLNFADKKFGLKLICGPLGNAEFAPNYFDVIILADVLEHFISPKEEIEKLRSILKPGGILYISTPDIDSFMSRVFKAKWWGIQKGHLYYFSKKTLSNLLDVCGFRPVGYASYKRVFSIDYWQKRLGNYNKNLAKLFGFFTGFFFLKNRLLGVSFYDQIEVFSRKKRLVSFIADDEKIVHSEKIKMKTIVVLPAYNAAKTLALTVRDIPNELVDEVILVDDASRDNTVGVASELGLKVFVHPKNKGYGANQKTCYKQALEMGAEIVVMVHPDYQYDPTVISRMIEPIQKKSADAVFGSRMMKGGALEGGMPLWKHNLNILLTALENVVLGTYLTEYHSGFRAYSAKYLNTVNFMANSDSFIFDNEIVVQGVLHYLKIEEIPIKTRYFEEASTIKFIPAVIYGLGILKILFKFILQGKGIIKFKQFN